MKVRKKFAAMLLSVLMVLTLLPAGALATATSASTVTGDTLGTLYITKHNSQSTFSLYKLFTMAPVPEANSFTYTATTDYSNCFTGGTVPTAKDISGYTTAQLTTFLSQIHPHFSGITSPVTLTADSTGVGPDNDKVYTATGKVDIGYYLVIETQTKGAQLASKDFLVSVPQGTTASDGTVTWNYKPTAQCKDTVPSFGKKIVQDSGTANYTSTGSDTAQKKIGDSVEYRLSADVPKFDPTADVTNIEFYMDDSLSAGLTYDGDSSVYAYGLDGSGHSTPIDAANFTTGKAPNLEFNFHGHFNTIKDYSKVVIFYSATINKNAVIGTAGNPNTATLTYSNNPKGGTNTTPPQTPRVFTTGIALDKKDALKTQNLSGAVFELMDASNNPLAVYGYDTDGKTRVDALKEKSLAKGISIITGSDGMTYFLGLNEGTYYIKEITAPSGYSLLADPIKVDITADIVNGNYDGNFHYSINGGTSTPASDNSKNNEILIDVQALDGFTLPGTGGIGTTIFFVSGIAILLLGGCMALVYTKKKKKIGGHFQH